MEDTFTRRGVLRTVAAGGAAAVAASGTAAAKPPEERIVGTSSPRAERAAKDRADRVDKVLDFEHIGKAVVGRFSDEAAEKLAKRGDVRYVEHNGTMEKFAETLPWGIDRVDADLVHSDGGTGSGRTIAVLDTGIDDDHPDLQANVVGGKAFETECGAEPGGCRYGAEGYNGNDCNYTWSDDDDHGSHVAGSADGVDNSKGVIGVATGADLLAGKVLSGCGSGSFSAISSGVKWAADQGADVINMSLGASSGSSTLKDACQYAYDNNVVIVAAAGNDGPCTDCVGYPAAYSTVVAVSATTPSDTLAGYSSTGPEVEIAAPGGANDGNDSTSILSTIPPESDDSGSPDGYAYFVGTSMASPHVAGAAALVKAETSLSDNQQIIDRLKSSAEDIGLASNESGAGLLDAEAAVGSSSDGDTSVAVSTDAASSVGTDNATLNGTLSDLGGASSADVYFEYGQSGGSLSNTTATQTLSSTGSFSADVTGLSSGTDYDYRAVAEASDGDTDTGSTVTFTTDSSTNNGAPAIDSYTVTEAGSPNPHAEITADWAVSDGDSNLDTVVVDVVDADTGSVVDSSTTAVSGSSASGSTSFKIKGRNETYDVTLTVTDTDGASESQTKQVTE